MSDKMRWRYSDTNPVVARVEADSVIEIGDFVWQDIDNAKAFEDVDDIETFLGVAMQRGETAPIRVATTGVFEFDCEQDSFELGDLITIIDKQKVMRGTPPIARVAEFGAGTSVLIAIRSNVMSNGVFW